MKTDAGIACLAVWSLLALGFTSQASANPPPNGSYLNSCSGAAVNANTLSANCTDLQGHQQISTLPNYPSCVGDIANFNGTLTCSNTNLPTGSYQKSCRFAYANLDSSNTTTLYANCKTVSGLWNWTSLVGPDQCPSPKDIANLDGTLACAGHSILPIGSYSNSCRNIWEMNGILNAECQIVSGGWVQTQIPVSQCSTPIANFNGTLVCSAGVAPTGSYLRSCSVAWIGTDADTGAPALSALCKTTTGASLPAKLLNYNQCSGDIANFDGILGCNINGTPPTGSYTQTCRFVWLDGNRLHAECKNRSGTWVQSTLDDANLCPAGSVANLDGTLACNYGSPVSGSYAQSCRDVWVVNNTLHAECETIAGNWLATSLGGINQCSGGASNINGILQCASTSGPNYPASSQVAGAMLYDQEQSNWCWAATGQMIMQYFGTDVHQCDEVKTEKGLENCCGYPRFSLPSLADDQMNCQGCDCGGSPPYSQYGHDGTYSSTPLSWQQLEEQIAVKNKPLSFAWNWCGGGAHVLVAFGYTTIGGNQVWVMDPLNPDPYLVPYAQWASNPNNNGTCATNDPVGHAFQGNEYDIN